MKPAEAKYFVFEVDQLTIGMRLSTVERVLPAAELMQPCSNSPSPGLVGFLNLEGKLIPVMNLRPLLRLSSKSLTPSDCIIIAHYHDTFVGVIIDEAIGVYSDDEMQTFSKELGSLNIAPTIEGFIHCDNKIVVIHDISKFIDSSVLSNRPDPPVVPFHMDPGNSE